MKLQGGIVVNLEKGGYETVATEGDERDGELDRYTAACNSVMPNRWISCVWILRDGNRVIVYLNIKLK